MFSSRKTPIPKSGSNITPRINQPSPDERFYSPQNVIDSVLNVFYIKSDQKKTTKTETENQQNLEGSDDTIFDIQDEEEEMEKISKVVHADEKKRSQFSQNCHGRVSRIKTFQLTGLEEKAGEVVKKKTQISCLCEFSRFDLIKKKSWKSIQIEEDAKILKSGKWRKTRCMLTNRQLAFIEISFLVQDISKVKIFQLNKDRNEQILKIQVDETSHFFSLDSCKKLYDFPLAFYMFSRIIIKKLQMMELGSLEQWQKTNHIQKIVTQDSYIYGKIYKKSQHLGVWSQRYVVIKSEGIYSYRDESKEENHSFFICKSNVKYMWTRLELTSSTFLVIKIKHGLLKTQFGIPINNYSCRGCKNWLYGFYRMLI